MNGLSAEARAEVEALAAPLIRGGFDYFGGAVKKVVERMESEADPEAVKALMADLWDTRVTAQADWPEWTEADLLARTFLDLGNSGITSEMDFTCCNSCGTAEIRGIASGGARGYVFFHQQDTEAVAMGGDLLLSYGSFDGSPTESIGHEIVAKLTEAGFSPVWNGSPDQRIELPIDWRMRIGRRRS